MTGERINFAPRFCFEKASLLPCAHGGEKSARWVKAYSKDEADKVGQSGNRVAGGRLPNANSPIPRTRREQKTVGRIGKAMDMISVSFEHVEAAGVADVPADNSAIRQTVSQNRRIWREGNAAGLTRDAGG